MLGEECCGKKFFVNRKRLLISTRENTAPIFCTARLSLEISVYSRLAAILVYPDAPFRRLNALIVIQSKALVGKCFAQLSQYVMNAKKWFFVTAMRKCSSRRIQR